MIVGLVALLAAPGALATEPALEPEVDASTPEIVVTEDATLAASESADADAEAVEAGMTVDARADARSTTQTVEQPTWSALVPQDTSSPDAAPRHSVLTTAYAVAHPELAQPTASTVLDATGTVEQTVRVTIEDTTGAQTDAVPELTPTAEETSDQALSPVRADTSASSTSDDAVHVEASVGAAGSNIGADSKQMPAPFSYAGYSWGTADETPVDDPDSGSSEAPGGEPAPAGPSFAQGAEVVPAVPNAVVAALAVTAAFGAASATAGFLFIPGWRAALMRALRASPLAFLFSRITKDEVLDHPKRADIFEFVKQNPGERVEAVRKALGLANGTMRHHLQVLRDKELVRKIKQGGITRLFPAGPKVEPLPYLIPPRRAILETVAQTPGLVQRQVGARLEMSERMVSYHVKQLADDGLVEVRRDGACNRVYPAVGEQKMARLLDAPSACPVS